MLHHQGQHVSIARFYPEGTIISNGLSKWCGAGGWRLGTFSFPRELEWLQKAMSVVASETYTSTSAPIQHAAITGFSDHPEIEDYLRKNRWILKQTGRVLCHQLHKMGLDTPLPHGGFYLFPNFEPYREKLQARGILNSVQFCDRVLEETGVAMLPGADFGRSEKEYTVRIAYVDFDGEKALAAVPEKRANNHMEDSWVSTHAPRLTTAFDRLGEWLAGL
jgi:aspartate aminotransferase